MMMLRIKHTVKSFYRKVLDNDISFSNKSFKPFYCFLKRYLSKT